MAPLILGDGLLGSELRKLTGWDYVSRKNDGIDFTGMDLREQTRAFPVSLIDDVVTIPPKARRLPTAEAAKCNGPTGFNRKVL